MLEKTCQVVKTHETVTKKVLKNVYSEPLAKLISLTLNKPYIYGNLNAWFPTPPNLCSLINCVACPYFKRAGCQFSPWLRLRSIQTFRLHSSCSNSSPGPPQTPVGRSAEGILNLASTKGIYLLSVCKFQVLSLAE